MADFRSDAVAPEPITTIDPNATGRIASVVETSARIVLSVAILVLFVLANVWVFNLVERFAALDAAMIRAHEMAANERIISSTVIVALVAGTVAQIVTILAAITGYLFPRFLR